MFSDFIIYNVVLMSPDFIIYKVFVHVHNLYKFLTSVWDIVTLHISYMQNGDGFLFAPYICLTRLHLQSYHLSAAVPT